MVWLVWLNDLMGAEPLSVSPMIYPCLFELISNNIVVAKCFVQVYRKAPQLQYSDYLIYSIVRTNDGKIKTIVNFSEFVYIPATIPKLAQKQFVGFMGCKTH